MQTDFLNSIYVVSLEEILWGLFLIALVMAVHGWGMVFVLKLQIRFSRGKPGESDLVLGLKHLLGFTWIIVGIHLIEIAMWAMFMSGRGILRNFATAFYVAMMDYTTLGSDIALPPNWRLLGGMMAIAGLITFAWSTAVLLKLVEAFQNRFLKKV